jgi:hypothetical protein
MPNRKDSGYLDLDLSHDEYHFPASPWQAMKVDPPIITTPLRISTWLPLPIRVQIFTRYSKGTLTSVNQSRLFQIFGHATTS